MQEISGKRAFAKTPAPSVSVRTSENGVLYLQSGLELPKVAPSLPHLFDEKAVAYPERIFVRDRYSEDGSWRSITYGEAKRAADGMAQWLIDHGVGFGDSVAFLSKPSIEHAIAAIGIQRSGAAIAPISVAYSLLSSDFGKLKDCMTRAGARFAIVDDASAFQNAMAALSGLGIEFVAVSGKAAGIRTASFADLVGTQPTAAVAERMGQLRPETTARIMYTSGSTGSPKAVPQSQYNLTLTVAQNEAVGLADFGGEGPQILEAMPFSHIMAGNFNFNNVIGAAGTINIDAGKPTPQFFSQTIANLREVSPHYFITVPVGFEMLCDAMEADTALRDSFFKNIRFLGFGGAVLDDRTKDRLLDLSQAARGSEVPILSFYGATEYLFGTLKYWKGGPTDVIGLPLPGANLKLKPEPQGNRFELWIKSGGLMPRSGYLGAPEASAGLFDEEDFYNTGDAVRFSDPARPEDGLVFAGRIADDFKLASGTFVLVKSLREDLLKALSGLVSEVVLCGVNERWIGALLWPRDPADAGSRHLHDEVSARITAFNRSQTGSSRRIGAARIMSAPLSFDENEVTDKGNVSARTVRQRRAEDVRKLFAEEHLDDGLNFLAISQGGN